MLIRVLLLVGWLLFGVNPCLAADDTKIDEADLRDLVARLSSDDMQGRLATKPGIEKAAILLEGAFARAGLRPYNNGETFRQSFKVKGFLLANIVGVLPGTDRAQEFVVFSAHYDHLGIGRPLNGDAIYNGANDDASGTAAVVELARYFHARNANSRTLIFAAFTAEEEGEYGSAYFSRSIDSRKVAAMINIEMIGTESKWGVNSAYLTGYEKSDLGEIMNARLKGTSLVLRPDPYPHAKLFYRSDNATLAALGVPAHTISTAKMDAEPYYHTPDDEISTLNFGNLATIVEAIAIGSEGLVDGSQTPRRVDVKDAAPP